jgi:two-component system sensor histidine kinase DesK
LVPLVIVQTALGLAFTATNDGALVFFVYAAATAARLDPPPLGARAVVLLTLLALLSTIVFESPFYSLVFAGVFTPLIGAVCWHAQQVARSDARLRLAQGEVARLAAVAERERIARDLHDVLGHTLTLIVLKAELASRLAESDSARAVREIREVEQVTRTALADVREAVSGYRATWDEEVERARALLAAAGVGVEFSGRPETRLMDRATEEALALAMREAITNVVRHARATNCTVRWVRDGDQDRLEIVDDGGGSAPAADRATEGNGLRGLRERIEALGGTVERGAGAALRGMRLAVTLPVKRHPERA